MSDAASPPLVEQPKSAAEVSSGQVPAVIPSVASENSVMVTAKSFKLVVLEGSLYFIISGLAPVATLLESGKEISARMISASILAGIIAGSISLKAFFSQSNSKKE
jgi:hypothetical protein